MIKIVSVLFALLFLSTTGVYAQATSSAKTPTAEENSTLNKQISDLKEKIASKVAELKLVEKRGILGTIKEVKETQITLTDINNNIRYIDVDELTKFASSSAKGTFGISDLTKGTTIGAYGLYNKDTRRLLARFIESASLTKIVRGGVSDKDTGDFTITVQDAKGQQTIVDIEVTTKSSSYTKEKGLLRYGFSKIQPGDNVIIIGNPSKTEKNRISGLRIIVFPQVPLDPAIAITKTEEPSATTAPTQTQRTRTTPSPTDSQQ